MKQSLYDIDGELGALLNSAQEFDETTPTEVVDAWLATFEEMKGERGSKLEAIAHVRNSALASTKAVQHEIDRLLVLQKREAKLADRMASMIELSMKNANEKEIKTDLFKAKFVKNPPRLILSEDLELSLKPGYEIAVEKVKEISTKFSEAKKDIKTKLKAGEKIEGAELQQSERLKIE